MPKGFNLDKTHPALLELATDVLLRPWNKEVKKPITKGEDLVKIWLYHIQEEWTLQPQHYSYQMIQYLDTTREVSHPC